MTTTTSSLTEQQKARIQSHAWECIAALEDADEAARRGIERRFDREMEIARSASAEAFRIAQGAQS